MDTSVFGANVLMSKHIRIQRGRSELRICNYYKIMILHDFNLI
jgi:hypothetical protein